MPEGGNEPIFGKNKEFQLIIVDDGDAGMIELDHPGSLTVIG